MKQFLSIFLSSTLSLSAVWAVPAHKGTIQHTQPDGTILTLRLVGDECMHYYLNLADDSKMRQGEDGHYYPIAESTIQILQESASARRQEAQQRHAQRMEQTRRMTKKDGPKKIGTLGNNMTGQKKGIVILVNFKDKAINSAHTQPTFDRMFNKAGYSENNHIGSVADYFKDQSYGLFELSFDVVGPVTLSNNMSYYGGNNAADSDKNPGAMIKEACNAVNNQVNFADYDWDGDGYVDQVFVIYAGYGENCGADANTIWPHEWTLAYATGSKLKLDNVWIDTYACCAELDGKSGSNLNGIGTACHEFSHCLGYPDSYDTDYSGGVGMDSYDIMCGGSYNGPYLRGEVPSGFTAYQRWMAGWLEPDILDGPANITDMPALNDEAKAYIIFNESNLNEYFIIENRQSRDWFSYFDGGTAGHGLFISHIDYNKTIWEYNTPNDDPNHQRMTWVPADKAYDNKYTSDYFPGTNKVTSFAPSAWTNAGGKWFTREGSNYYSSHALSKITENTSTGTISFVVDGGDDGTRYTITYNAGGGACTTSSWTQTTSSMQSTTLPAASIDSEEWTFAGWSTFNVTERTNLPTLYKAGETYLPSSNETLYAVYTKTVSADGSAIGTYTLDWNAETNLQSKTLGYGIQTDYTTTDGGNWLIKAYKNAGLQINKSKDASIKVPDCPSPISSISITAATARIFNFSTTDYTGSNNPTAVASSSSSTSATIDLSGKGLSTGYIYTTAGSSVITKIVVTYGGTGTTYYATSPSLVTLPTPTITFAQPNATGKSMLVGDTYTNTATASCEGIALPTVSYTSSRTEVATVKANGEVTAVGTGTTTITAAVNAVANQHKAARATYTINVTMPALSSIAITTAPTQTAYKENDNFSTEGMVVTATYSNGYSCPVTGYTYTPSPISKDTKQVIISYSEGGITRTATVDISVTPLPRYTVTFASGSGSCTTATLTETAYQSGVMLPVCADVNEDWTFAGWAAESVSSATTTRPASLLASGTTYKPSGNCTLYAVYKMTEGMENGYKEVTSIDELTDGIPVIISSLGTCQKTLANNNGTISAIDNYPVSNGILICSNEAAIWTLKGNTSSGWTFVNNSKFLYRSSGNVSASTSKTTWTITQSTSNSNKFLVKDKNSTYYLESYTSGWAAYSISGTPTSNQISYVGLTLYIPASTVIYHSAPNATLIEPQIVFNETNAEGKAMLVGDTYTNAATLTGSEQTITYSSSDASVATVSNNGEVKAVKAGTTTISASIPAVTGISKSANASYVVNVSMPVLSSIAITSQPIKTSYNEGETFSTEGIIVTATYENGYTRAITEYTYSPSKALSTSDEAVIISYSEGGVTKTADIVIEVKELPKYTVTFYDNGTHTELVEATYRSGVNAPSASTIEGYTFVGWSTSPCETESQEQPTIVSLAEGRYMPTSNITLYAIYSRTEQSEEEEIVYNINTGISNFPTKYGTPNTLSLNDVSFNLYNVGHFNNNNKVQFKKSDSNTIAGYISNESQLASAISSIIIHESSATTGFTLSIGSTSSPSTTITASSNGNTLTFDCSGQKATYFKLSGNNTTLTAQSIVITCGTPSVTYYTSNPICERSISLIANVGDNYYATFGSDKQTFFPTPAEGDCSFKLYSININNGKLVFNELNKTSDPAGYYVDSFSGVLICAQFKGNDHTVKYNIVNGLPADFDCLNDVNLLHAAELDKGLLSDCLFYKLAYNNYTNKEGLGFYWGAVDGGPFASKAGGAYLAIPTAKANMIRGFSFDESIYNEASKSEYEFEDDVPLIIFTLMGQRIQKVVKDGLYIINGKTQWLNAE